MSDFNIDATNPENLSVLKEKETRKRLLKHARLIGCEREMVLLFDKYDSLLKRCSNESERKDIAKLGCFEIYSLLGKGGELYVDNQLVAKDD